MIDGLVLDAGHFGKLVARDAAVIEFLFESQANFAQKKDLLICPSSRKRVSLCLFKKALKTLCLSYS